MTPVDDDLALLAAFAEMDPLVDADWGQGGRGTACKFCRADTWSGPLEHKPSCPWVKAKQRVDGTA